MFDSTRGFFRRHRTNILAGAGLVGASYLAVQYVGSKLSEARTRMMSDRVARENINRRFQQNQEDCSYTVLALLPTATENIIKAYPVETLTQELQQKKAARIAKSSATSTVTDTPTLATEDDTGSLKSFASESFAGVPGREDKPKKSKIVLWDEIKIASLTRSFTLLYTLSLLTLLTRVQLNLLGRKNYLSSVLSLAQRNDNDPTIKIEHHESPEGETNRQYLTFSWYLLHRGWRRLSTRVEEATKRVFGGLTPRDSISLGRFRELTMEVRRIVESDEEGKEVNWLKFLLPPREEEGVVLAESGTQEKEVGTELRRLLDETSDLLESPMGSTVLAHILAVAFELLIDGKLASLAYLPKGAVVTVPEKVGGAETADESDASVIQRITPVVEDSATAKFASVLAVLARQAHVIGNGAQNEYLAAMEKGTELEGFSALVYSSNFEFAVQEHVRNAQIA